MPTPAAPATTCVMRSPAIARIACVLALGPALGCPAEVETGGVPRSRSKSVATVDENDPRVAKVGEDLYSARALERAAQKRRLPAEPGAPGDLPEPDEAGADQAADPDAPPDPTAPPPVGGRGSGKPDETNGVCRLYAPKLANPECCKQQLGFDVQAVKKACGLDLYLGESFRGSCGYHFLSKDGQPSWFRLSSLTEESVDDAAKTHDRKLGQRRDTQASEPLPGIPGAKVSKYDQARWAFLPGFGGKVRQLSWSEKFCSDEAMQGVMKQLVAAKPKPRGTKRALVPAG